MEIISGLKWNIIRDTLCLFPVLFLLCSQTVKLEMLEEKWFKLLDEPVKKIELERDQVTVVYFRIKALDVGIHNLTVYASGSEMSDAIKRNIEIAPNGKMYVSTESD